MVSSRAVVNVLRGVEAVTIVRSTVGVRRWAHLDTEVRPQRKEGPGMIPDRPEESPTPGNVEATARLGMTANIAT